MAAWSFVGREGELSWWREFLQAPRHSLVLAGAAGVGKTRLASEFLREAERSGFPTARVAANRATARIPLGAVAPLLPGVDHDAEAGAVDNLADLLRRSAAVLTERAGDGPLILWVDDAHLLDDASATLIYQVAAAGTVVVATLRSGEPAPEPILALWKDGIAERIDLDGLGSKEIAELLAAALSGPLDPAALVEIAAHCEGNVLFLREVVLGAIHDGTLRDDGGIFRLVGPLSPSDRLVELVEARLAGLEPSERGLLELVAWGEPLGPGELGPLTDLDLVERLERKALLASHPDGRRLVIRLAHPLYGDVLRARMPGTRSRSIARALAQQLESTDARRREDTLRIGTWRLDSGGARPDLMLAAATAARWRYDFPLAERLARAAIESGAGYPASVLAAQLVSLQGRGAAAEQELAALAQRATTDAERGLVAVTRLDNYMIYAGAVDDGLRMAESVEAAIADQRWRDEITARRVVLLLGSEGPRASAEVAEPLIARAEGRALAWGCMGGAYSLARLGRINAALAASERGLEAQLAVTVPLDWYPSMHLFYRSESLAHAGRLREAAELTTAQYELAVSERSIEAQAIFAWQLSKTVGERGHVEDAAQHGREAIALFRQLGRPQFIQFSTIYLALAQALGGHAEQARRTLQSIDDLGIPPTLYMGVDLLNAQAWTEVAGGDNRVAKDVFVTAARLGRERGDNVGAASALHAIARLGWAKEVVEPLADLAGEMEGDLPDLRSGHATALAAGRPDALAKVAAAFEAAGAYLLAAEATAAEAGVWRKAGEVKSAGSADRRAAALAARCAGARTPALSAAAGWVGLTPAETETALLAARGRSNKQIAEALTVSVRTIETRLQHVYRKLGVQGRGELTDALDSLAVTPTTIGRG